MLARIKAMPPAFPNPVYRLVMLIAGLLIVAASALSSQPKSHLLFLGVFWFLVPLSDYARSYSLTLAALLRLSALICSIVVIVLSLYSIFS